MYQGDMENMIGYCGAPYLAIPQLCEGCKEARTRGRFCRDCAELNVQLERRFEETRLNRMMESLPREQCGVVELERPVLTYRPMRAWEFAIGVPLVFGLAALLGTGLWLAGIELVRMMLGFSS